MQDRENELIYNNIKEKKEKRTDWKKYKKKIKTKY